MGKGEVARPWHALKFVTVACRGVKRGKQRGQGCH